MQSISSDLSSILQLNQFTLQINNPQGITPVSGNLNQQLLNDIAVSTPSSFSNASVPFDMAMNDIASYKDVMSAAQNSISQMRTQGQSIKDIIAQAQQGGLTKDLIDKMQTEVDEKILDISIIKDAAESNGVDSQNPNSISISDMQSLMGVTSSDSVISSLTNGLTTYDMDISFDLEGISFEGSAKIAMGMKEDGSFQFAFDVSLNYDLSELSSEGEGITSPNAAGIIDNFMNMLDSQEGVLGKANKIIDSAFQKIFDSMNSTLSGGNQDDAVNSSIISKQIMQQSTNTMNSIMMNQLPGLALNLI